MVDNICFQNKRKSISQIEKGKQKGPLSEHYKDRKMHAQDDIKVHFIQTKIMYMPICATGLFSTKQSREYVELIKI